VYEQGLTALHTLLREDAEEIAGLTGKHQNERTHKLWGTTNGELSFGGRRIQVSRPRVRSKSGEEASLPHFEAFREELVSWLERNGDDEAAGSLREGMEESLTVLKLALPESLRKSLATTNAIENLNGTIRSVSRNVKRWKSPSMIRRWTALGVVTAEKKFRRIKGHRHMSALVHALRSNQKSLDSGKIVAQKYSQVPPLSDQIQQRPGHSRAACRKSLKLQTRRELAIQAIVDGDAAVGVFSERMPF